MVLLALSLNAQVNGIVKDGYSRILKGVLVTSENGKNITITDSNGEYDLVVNDGSDYLKFTLTGYISQNLKIDNQSMTETLNVTMQRAETYNLDEVYKKQLFGCCSTK